MVSKVGPACKFSGCTASKDSRARTISAVIVGAVIAANAIASESACGQGRESGAIMRIKMPGASFQGELPELTEREAAIRDQLKKDLEKLAGEIGERNTRQPREYALAAQWIEQSMTAAGYQVARQTFQVKGKTCVNLEAEIVGAQRRDEVIVLGAHYDSMPGTAGANDNGTGVVALLTLARRLSGQRPLRTLRFVFFANEEPPHFQTAAMGSLVYARRCQQRKEKIAGMLSLETIGYYSDEKGSQHYPPPFSYFYPSTGNFIAFVGNAQSAKLVTQCVGTFRDSVKFPSEGAAVPGSIQEVGWSDHWSFWQAGYLALMVTDTAPFRYPHYHRASDTPDKINYDRMARVVTGLEVVARALANPQAAAEDGKREGSKKKKSGD